MRQQGCIAGFTGRIGRGFTLIELLVVVAVIALLIGILLPALGSARAAAWQSKSAQNQRQFMLAMQTYANTYNFYLPGINTSGIRNLDYQNNQQVGVAVNRTGNAPVQQYDWLSPILDDRDLPPTRPDRLLRLMEQYRDPAMRERLSVDNLEISSWDSTAMTAIASSGEGLASPSYLMPYAWQFAGETLTNNGTTTQWGVPEALAPSNQGIRLPAGWFPRLDRVGPEAKKAAIMDGVARPTQNGLEANTNIWINPTATPFEGGFFLADTPTRAASDVYGNTNSGNATEGANLALAYRHGRRMNVGFFDGHVETLNRDQSVDPALWFPTGSTWLGGAWIDPAANNLGYDTQDFNRIN